MYTIEEAKKFIDENEGQVHPKYRQKIHLQPPVGWMNDPNGFIVIENEIHLFYQFFPYDSVWGPMHWGHAKTQDGLHWIYLPPALAPDQLYDQSGCFSGTALLKDEELILMYTGGMIEKETALQQQCIARSTDYLTFEKERNNPVISKKDLPKFVDIREFRDPKIIQHKDRYYALIVTKTAEKTGSIVLFESSDCLHWLFKSVVLTGTEEFGEMWECPDLIDVDGKDVLIFSAINMPSKREKYTNLSSCIYFVGAMDWETGTYTYSFCDEIDAGLDFYAPQMTKLNDGTPILVAWMQMWDRTIPSHELGHRWAGCMTLIRKLSLVNNKLLQTPLLPALKEKTIEKSAFSDFEGTLDSTCLDIQLKFCPKTDFSLRFYNDQEELLLKKEKTIVTLDRSNFIHRITGKEKNYQEYTCWIDEQQQVEQLQIILDTSSIEVFIGNGEKTMSMRFFSEKELDRFSITSNKGQLKQLIMSTIV